jgi:hypothetical protein
MALALAGSIGLHWAVLQSVAWTTMLVDNLRTTSFSAAVGRTFDGQHPCPLCKAVAEGRKSEKKSDTLLPLKKFEALNQAATIAIPPAPAFPPVEAQASFFAPLAPAPPTPPPRAA